MLRFGHLSRATPATGPTIRTTVNLVVTAGLAYALHRQFFVANDFLALWGGFRQNVHRDFAAWIVGIAALMPVNLYLEGFKLRSALPEELRPAWRSVFGQVCAGIAVGLWTPGRVGEFAGRLARTAPVQRGPILAATALGGVAQWSPLLIGGGAAVLLWRTAVPVTAVSDASGVLGALHRYLYGDLARWLGLGSVVVGVGASVLFFAIADLARAVKRWRFPGRIAALGARLRIGALLRADFLRAFRAERGALFAASVARYLVYLAQMSAAFVAFGIDVGLGAAILATAALLLLHGFLPVPPALQAVARIEFALLLFAYRDPNEVAIAAASLFVFALNLALPAFVGWLFIVRRHDLSPSP